MKSGNMAEILIANGAGLLLLIILLICRSMTGRNRRPSDKIFFAIIRKGRGTQQMLPLFRQFPGIRLHSHFRCTLGILC